MNDYDYRYKGNDIYCYPNTTVLKNKFNITNQTELSGIERKITLYKMLFLDENPIDGNFDFEHLLIIHKILFEEIYDWAGKIRVVDISKGTMFCKCEYIEKTASMLFSELKSENYLKEMSINQIVKRLAYYMCEINAIHPFREGNGRVQRIFISQLARKNGYSLNFSNVTEEEMIYASVQGFINNYEPMEKLIAKSIKHWI